LIKNNIDYKLINISIITLIVFLMYQTSSLWLGLFHKLYEIILPFLLSFALAYTLHPLMKFLERHKVPRCLSLFLIISLLVGIIAFIIITVVPMLAEQLIVIFNAIITFIKEISLSYDLNVGELENIVSSFLGNMIINISNYVSDGAINILNVSFTFISRLLIVISIAVYLIIDMDKIRKNIKKRLKDKEPKWLLFISKLDKAMQDYVNAFVKIIIITFFEYTLAYTIIGHPNALLLGLVSAMANIVPCFGGLIANILAAIMAFVIGKKLFIRTIITFLVLAILDSYVINPNVFGKASKIHPLIVIMSIFVGGILFGLPGIIFSLPLSILVITTINFYRDEKMTIIKRKKVSEN